VSSQVIMGYWKPYEIVLVKIDSESGNIIWDKKLDIGESLQINGYTYAHDGDFILCGTVRLDVQTPGTLYITKLDSEGNIVRFETHEKELEDAFGGKVISLKNGGYATCIRERFPRLIIFDEGGQLLYIADYRFEEYMDPVELENGDLMIFGNEGATEQYEVWYIKVSENGEFISSSRDVKIENSLHLYPVPSQGILHLKNHNSIEYSLHDIQGNLVQQGDIIHDMIYLHKNQPDGLYVITLWSADYSTSISRKFSLFRE